MICRSPEWTADVYLEAGPHSNYVMQYAPTKEHFTIKLEGPGIQYGDIPPNIQFQQLDCSYKL